MNTHEHFDIIEISDDNHDYEPEDTGLFAVQYDGECKSLHETLSSAITDIQKRENTTGEGVSAVPDVNYYSGNRWTIHTD